MKVLIFIFCILLIACDGSGNHTESADSIHKDFIVAIESCNKNDGINELHFYSEYDYFLGIVEFKYKKLKRVTCEDGAQFSINKKDRK